MEKTTSHQIREQVRRFEQQIQEVAADHVDKLARLQHAHFQEIQSCKGE